VSHLRRSGLLGFVFPDLTVRATLCRPFGAGAVAASRFASALRAVGVVRGGASRLVVRWRGRLRKSGGRATALHNRLGVGSAPRNGFGVGYACFALGDTAWRFRGMLVAGGELDGFFRGKLGA
jgi:hypothetical protein